MTEREDRLAADARPEREEGGDTLGLLAEALTSYLEEVDGYRSICVRHERTAAVYSTKAALHVVRLFNWTQRAVAHVRSASGRLPGWKHSPFWDTHGERWTELEINTKKRQATETVGTILFTRGVAWEGRPMLVCASGLDEKHFLRVELLLLPFQEELPELPLRTVADALVCHEHLLPEWAAAALPVPTVPDARLLSIREYLARVMPQNLYASQCYFLSGAEK